MKNFFLAVGMIAGTAIGAGIFSLPYIFNKLGMLTGLFYLVVFALIYYLVHWQYAQVLQSSSKEHHFSYFAKKYLSKFWEKIASVTVICGLIFSLTIYLILSRTFAGLIFGETGVIVIIVFWVLSSVLIFSRSALIGWAEIIGGLGIVFITLLILIGGGDGQKVILPAVRQIGFWEALLPFGPLLFAFSSRAAVSKVVGFYRSLSKRKRFPLKKAILWGTLLPVFVYLIFILGVLRLVPGVSPDTLGSLEVLPQGILLMIGVIGLLALWTSYFVIGSNIYDILRFDILKKNRLAGIITLLAPLGLYFLGFKNFMAAVLITGGLFLALESIFVTTMWLKMKDGGVAFVRVLPLYLVFLLAIVYQILGIFR